MDPLIIYFQQYNNSKLLKGILYQLTLYNSTEIIIDKIIANINLELNKKYKTAYNIKFISYLARIIYNSYIVTLNLPHMLNNPMYADKPAIHIIMNESLAQLVSISLISESYKIIDYFLKDSNLGKDKILNIKKECISLIQNIRMDNVENLILRDKYYLERFKEDLKEKLINSCKNLAYKFYEINFEIINNKNNLYI